MRTARILAASAILLGFLIVGASVSAAADRLNTAFVNAPNAPFDTVIRSIRLTDKTPTTVLVALGDVRELTTAGEVLAVNIGDLRAEGNGIETKDWKRTTIRLPLGSNQAQREIFRLGNWETQGRASAAAVGSDTIEFDLPDPVTVSARSLWITRRAPDTQDDIPVSPLYSLNDLASNVSGGFGASSVAWTDRGGPFSVASVAPGPEMTINTAAIHLTFSDDPPTTVGDQKVKQVLDILQIRPNGESGTAPFRLEIDETKGMMTGYSGTSSKPLTYTPPGTARPREGANPRGTGVPGPVTYTTSIGKVAAGSRVEIPMATLELGFNTSFGDQAQTAITRRVLLDSGASIFFDGVSVSANKAALAPSGTVPVASPAVTSSRLSPMRLAVAGGVFVVCVIIAWSLWLWARETEWYRFRSDTRKFRKNPE